MTAWWNLVGKLKFSVFLQAAGVGESENIDREFFLRLASKFSKSNTKRFKSSMG